MELIFKKYHKSEQHIEKKYLIYDPARNHMQFTNALLKSISHRNFGQSYDNILIGPIMNGKKMTVKVLASDGTEVSSNPNTQKIFEAYLKDQGYTDSSFRGHSSSDASYADIRAFGTVYYFPA